MTPMTRLKNNLDTFRNLLGDEFKEFELNKASSKSYTTEGETFDNKGVESDYIRVFQVKLNKEDTYSLALRFNYIDLPEDKHTVEFSVKKGRDNKKMMATDPMTVDNFKTTLNTLNADLKDKPLAFHEKIEMACLHFLPAFTAKTNKAKKNNPTKTFIKLI